MTAGERRNVVRSFFTSNLLEIKYYASYTQLCVHNTHITYTNLSQAHCRNSDNNNYRKCTKYLLFKWIHKINQKPSTYTKSHLTLNLKIYTLEREGETEIVWQLSVKHTGKNLRSLCFCHGRYIRMNNWKVPRK